MKTLRPLLVITTLALLAGCATKPAKKAEYTFFPPAPDEPRIQFLTSFGQESDLGEMDKFKAFVVGQDKRIKPIYKPYGISTGKGKLYICDTEAANVSEIDLASRQMHALRPSGKAALELPINVVVDADGTRYVSDVKRMQVLIYNKDNKFQAAIGKGNEMKPSGLALRADNLYVTDVTNHCVRVFNKSSREQRFTIPRDASNPNSRLFLPTNVTLDEAGHIYVTDTGAWRVQVYDSEGNYVRSVGEMGLEPGRFSMPKGLGVDRHNRLFVVDAATQVVQLFDEQGRLLLFFGYPESSGPGALYLPAGLAIDYDNVSYFQKYAAPGYQVEYLILVANQAGSNKVSVFGFLKKS
jgi:DNA-binding beta-propeller fold protein YncE